MRRRLEDGELLAVISRGTRYEPAEGTMRAARKGREAPWAKGNKYRRGATMSEEAKAKLSAANMGKRQSEEHRRKISEGLRRYHDSPHEKRPRQRQVNTGKTWRLQSPNGQVHETTNLKRFCEEHELNHQSMHHLLTHRGRDNRYRHRGWTYVKDEENT